MRSRVLGVAAILGLAVSIPAIALAAKPAATTKQDTAVAYFVNGTDCAILTLWQGMYRPTGSDTWSNGQGFDVQLGELVDGDCVPSAAEGLPLDPADYEIIPLAAAYLVAPIEVDSRNVEVDVSWVAVGKPQYASEIHDDWSFVGKEVAAHLTGTIEVDGTPWDAQQDSAILRDFSVSKNF